MTLAVFSVSLWQIKNHMSNTQLRQVYIDIEEILRMIFESIRTDKTAFIDAALSPTGVASLRSRITLKVAARHGESPVETESSEGVLRTGEGLKISESARTSLAQITDRLSRLVELSRQKAQKHLLFSDKAFQEIEYLFGSLKYLFRCLGEVETSRSSGTTLLKYITDTAGALDEATQRFAAEHEERLIAGLCNPLSTPVYLDLLQNIRQILSALKSLTREIKQPVTDLPVQPTADVPKASPKV